MRDWQRGGPKADAQPGHISTPACAALLAAPTFCLVHAWGPWVGCAPERSNPLRQNAAACQPSLQLLPQNVPAKIELRPNRDPKAVTPAIQYVREKIIVNKVAGYANAKVMGRLIGNPASEAVKHYRVRTRRPPVQETLNNLREYWPAAELGLLAPVRLGRGIRVQRPKGWTREKGHLLKVAVIELRSGLIGIVRDVSGNGDYEPGREKRQNRR